MINRLHPETWVYLKLEVSNLLSYLGVAEAANIKEYNPVFIKRIFIGCSSYTKNIYFGPNN
jgi:hypothetical protein